VHAGAGDVPERSRGRRAPPVDRGDDVHFEHVLLLCWNVTVTTERSNEKRFYPSRGTHRPWGANGRGPQVPFETLGFSKVEDADASEGGQRLLK
jgi:hypothetical protein